jgi:hypothetical protein
VKSAGKIIQQAFILGGVFTKILIKSINKDMPISIFSGIAFAFTKT